MKYLLTAFVCLGVSLAFAQPANDDCIDAIVISDPSSWCDTASNVGATNDTFDDIYMGLACTGVTPLNDVWYTFTTSDTNSSYIITLTGIDYNGDDPIENPVIVVYSYDPGEGLPCEPQISGSVSSTLPFVCESADIGDSELEIDLTGNILSMNETYYFMVGSYSPTASALPGGFQICINEDIPFNNFCSTVDMSVSGDTVYCGNSYTGQISANLSMASTLETRYEWSPATSLSSTNVSNPTVTNLTANTDYAVEVVVLSGQNLITNGDFSDGDNDFTTGYIPGTGGTWGLLSTGGQYAVDDNPGDTHTNFCDGDDHTGDTEGMMMVVNGAWTPTDVWCQTITVQPDTWYDFSTWAMSVVSNNPAILQFSINDVLLGNSFTLTSTTCVWDEFYEQWYSDTATSATICITNQSTAAAGNDFAIDDIVLQPICFFTDTVSINLMGNTFDVVETSSICEGENVAIGLLDIDGIDYEWSPATGLSDTDIGNPIADPSVSTTYTLVASNGICSDTAEAQVNVDIIPTANLTSSATNGTICYGDSVSFELITNAPAQATYSWSPSAFFTNPRDLAPTILPTANGNYMVTVNNNGCTAADTVNLSLTFPPIYNINPNSTICSGDSVQIGYIDDASTNYTWTPVVDLNSANIGNPWASPTTTTTFTLIASNSNCIDTVEAIVNVTQLPTVDLVSDALNDTICPNDEITLSVNTDAPATAVYSWLPTGSFMNPNAVSQTLAAADNSTFYISINNDGCINNDSITIGWSALPQYGLLPVEGRTICIGETVILGTIDDPSTNYLWTASDPTISDPNMGMPSATPNESTLYTLTAFNDYCSETTNLTIAVIDNTFDVQDIVICEGSDVSATALGLGLPNGFYTWYSSEGVVYSTEMSANIPSPSEGYYYVDFDNNGCTHTDSFYISYVTPFTVSITADPSTDVPYGTTVTLSASANPMLNNPDYLWSDGSATPSIDVDPLTDTDYSVTITSEEGCSAEGRISLKIIFTEDAKVPNVFTPDELSNSHFYPVISDGSAQVLEFKVFDRWGELLHDNTNIPGWNGDFNGEAMPQDVYVYYVKIRYADNRTETLKGSVTLLR